MTRPLALACLIAFAVLTRLLPHPPNFASITGSCLLFLLTNFAVWAGGTLYPHTAGGLAECFAAAVPFFKLLQLGLGGKAMIGSLGVLAVTSFALLLLRQRLFTLPRPELIRIAVIHLGAGLHYLQEDHAQSIGRSVAGWIAGIEAASANQVPRAA